MTGSTSSYQRVKRGLDVLGAGTILLVSLPVQAVVAALVAVRLGRPVLFRQARPGLGGKVFELVKFRTMLSVDEQRGLITDEQRLTGLGKALRATSLDELPTLWNVLKGDLSLVGPRPLLVDYLPLYNEQQARRHEVRPGVTGLAQVRGRNAISWEEKFAWDVEYVDNASLALDFRILALTVVAVFKRSGINQEGQATMTKFAGEDGS